MLGTSAPRKTECSEVISAVYGLARRAAWQPKPFFWTVVLEFGVQLVRDARAKVASLESNRELRPFQPRTKGALMGLLWSSRNA